MAHPDLTLTDLEDPGAAETAGSTVPKRPWDGARIARLGFLVGAGHTAEKIAEDPLIASTETNVYRQAGRFRLSFREADAHGISLQPDVALKLDAAAQRRWTTRGELIKLVLTIAAREPHLLDNILDDGR